MTEPARAATSGTAGAFAVLSTGEIVARLLSFAAVLLLTRALGVEAFGVVALALAVVTYAELAVDFGLTHLGQLEVARGRFPVPALVSAVVSSRIAIAVVAGAALLGFARWAPLPEGATEVVALFGLILVPRAFELDWVLLGARRTHPVAWATVAGEAVLAGGVLLAVREPGDVLRVPLVYLGARATRAAIDAFASIRRFDAPRRLPDPAIASGLLRQATPIAAAIGFGLLFQVFTLVYVGIVLGAEGSGLYGASFRLYLLLFLLAGAYFKAFRPDLGRASVRGFESIEGLFGISLRVTGAVTVGVAVGGCVLAEPLLVFFFGPSYAEASGVLRALLVTFAVGTVVQHHRDLLVAFGEQRIDLAAVAVAASLNVALVVLATPGWGVVGAASATAISACLLLGLVVPAARRRVGRVPIGIPSPRVLGSGAVLAAVLLLVDEPHVLVRVVLGGTCYLGLLLASGAVRLDDVRDLERGLRGAERSHPGRGTDSSSRTAGSEAD